MKKVIAISEIVGTVEKDQTLYEVCATLDAAYDDTTSELVTQLDSYARPLGPSGDAGRVLLDELPRKETVREPVALDEAGSAAKDIFHTWARKVRQAIPNLTPRGP